MARPNTSRGLLQRPVARPTIPRGGIVQFFSETVAELRKAVWPTRQEVVRLTYIVIIISGIIGFILGGLDYGYTQTVTRFVFT